MVDELARLGLSVNYRRVMYLEMTMGLPVIQQFTGDVVVSPPGLRRRVFTAISLFHARSTMDDGQKRGIPVVPSGDSKITPPVIYTKKWSASCLASPYATTNVIPGYDIRQV